MTKKEMATALKDEVGGGLTLSDSKIIADSLFQIIKKKIKKEGEFSYHGFGKFVVHERSARTGRNPQTGESIKIPASKNVKFKPAADLKALVN